MTENLLLQIEKLPEDKGVFCFYDDKKLPLYVSVAKNIKEEVCKTLFDKNSFLNISKIDEIKFAKSSSNKL